MSAPMLEVSGLNAWYGAAHILFDLSFRIEQRVHAGTFLFSKVLPLPKYTS